MILNRVKMFWLVMVVVSLVSGCSREERASSSLSDSEVQQQPEKSKEKMDPFPIILGWDRNQVMNLLGQPPKARIGFGPIWEYEEFYPDYHLKVKFSGNRATPPEESFARRVDLELNKQVAVCYSPQERKYFRPITWGGSDLGEKDIELPNNCAWPKDIPKGREVIPSSILKQKPAAVFGKTPDDSLQELIALWPLTNGSTLKVYFVQREEFWRHQFNPATGTYSSIVLTTPKEDIDWKNLAVARCCQRIGNIDEVTSSILISENGRSF